MLHLLWPAAALCLPRQRNNALQPQMSTAPVNSYGPPAVTAVAAAAACRLQLLNVNSAVAQVSACRIAALLWYHLL